MIVSFPRQFLQITIYPCWLCAAIGDLKKIGAEGFFLQGDYDGSLDVDGDLVVNAPEIERENERSEC